MNDCKNCKIFKACTEAKSYDYFSQQEPCKLFYPIKPVEPVKEEPKTEQTSMFMAKLNSKKFAPITDSEFNDRRNKALKLLED